MVIFHGFWYVSQARYPPLASFFRHLLADLAPRPGGQQLVALVVAAHVAPQDLTIPGSGTFQPEVHQGSCDSYFELYGDGYKVLMNIHLPAILMFTRGTRF